MAKQYKFIYLRPEKSAIIIGEDSLHLKAGKSEVRVTENGITFRGQVSFLNPPEDFRYGTILRPPGTQDIVPRIALFAVPILSLAPPDAFDNIDILTESVTSAMAMSSLASLASQIA